MGRVVRDFANGRMLAYIPGGFEFVAARDIVEGHLLAMRKGRSGHKYIFSTRFTTVDELMDMLSRVTGRGKPPLRLPAPLMAGIAEVSSRVLQLFPSLPQRLTPGAVRILRMHRRADLTKARMELGYQPTSIEEALRAAYEWFVADGQIVGKQAGAARSAKERAA
jgi:nucleoside-diphosphate-sugar epimerase